VPDGNSEGEWILRTTSYTSLPVLPELAPFSGLPPGLKLRFEHELQSFCGFDGGVLEYSINGSTWTDAGALMTQGGYNSVMLTGAGSPIEGRRAWSGDLGGWTTVEADFSDFEGVPQLYLRWRFVTVGTLGAPGWYVDNVVLEAPVRQCEAPRRRNVPGAYCRGQWGAAVGWPVPTCGTVPIGVGGRRR